MSVDDGHLEETFEAGGLDEIGCKLERASAQIFERSVLSTWYLAITNSCHRPRNESRVPLHLSNLDVARDVRQGRHHYVRNSQNHRGRK